jgi:hypothetical protein
MQTFLNQMFLRTILAWLESSPEIRRKFAKDSYGNKNTLRGKYPLFS